MPSADAAVTEPVAEGGAPAPRATPGGSGGAAIRAAFSALRSVQPSTWFYLFIALVATAPAWIVQNPPMQDWPFHLATIRTVHSIHDPAFGMDADLTVALGRTQYLLYYLGGSLLSYVMPASAANVVLASVYLGGTVLALGSLLRALKKDARLCLFVVPILVNVMFMYGLFPFLLGIPIMFFGLATAVRHFEAPSWGRGAALTAIALALFYSHVFPFGIFALGFAAMFPWTRPRRWLAAAAPVLPAAGVLAWWTFATEAGRLTRGALTDSSHDHKMGIDQAISEAHHYITGVFRDGSDELLFVAAGVLALLATGLAHGERAERPSTAARMYVLLPIACVFLYFTTPLDHGYIWLIAQRFPILFAMTSIPLLRMPTGVRGGLVFSGAVGLALFSVINTCKHFVQFETTPSEVGQFQGAIDAIPPGKKVCALIYEPGSEVMGGAFAPYLHFGSYYQAEKGGVVMFTYAGYAHWPVAFKPGRFPPQGEHARERWEWEARAVSIDEIFPYYDYVLTRGYGFDGRGRYHLKWRGDAGDKWAVWERD